MFHSVIIPLAVCD